MRGESEGRDGCLHNGEDSTALAREALPSLLPLPPRACRILSPDVSDTPSDPSGFVLLWLCARLGGYENENPLEENSGIV